VLGYTLLEIALWSLGWTQLAWGLTALACVALITARGKRAVRELGTGWAGFRRSCPIIPLAAAIGAAGMLLAGWAGTLHLARGLPLWHACLYALWAMVQEFLVQSFIFVRLETLFGGRRAVVTSAVLFAAAHLPNPVLMVATFIMGLILTYWFWRHRNIYALGIAHALLGLALSITLPNAITHGMHVGSAFFASQSPGRTLGQIRFRFGLRLSARMGAGQEGASAPPQNR
jgi:membrane protease YdiL (CAAX protease family)